MLNYDIVMSIMACSESQGIATLSENVEQVLTDRRYNLGIVRCAFQAEVLQEFGRRSDETGRRSSPDNFVNENLPLQALHNKCFRYLASFVPNQVLYDRNPEIFYAGADSHVHNDGPWVPLALSIGLNRDTLFKGRRVEEPLADLGQGVLRTSKSDRVEYDADFFEDSTDSVVQHPGDVVIIPGSPWSSVHDTISTDPDRSALIVRFDFNDFFRSPYN